MQLLALPEEYIHRQRRAEQVLASKAAAMATLQSYRLITRAPAPFAVAVTARPLSAFVPLGCHHHWPSLNHGQPGAILPCLVVRAHALPPDESAAEFDEERERVMDRYEDIIQTNHGGCLYMEGTKMSGQLCLLADQALKMASQIMSSASLNLGAPNEISADTIRTTLRAYVEIFVDAADAAHDKTASKNTATSFLAALRGLASVSHVLLDAALDALSQTHPRESLAEYALNCDVEAMCGELGRQMDGIEDGVSKTSAAPAWSRVVMPGISEATRITGSLVRLMVARRERALGKANSKLVAV